MMLSISLSKILYKQGVAASDKVDEVLWEVAVLLL